MATFLQVPYYEVAVAAAIPAVLYFGALFMQIDSYAGRNNVLGLPPEAIEARANAADGWYYLGAFAVLVVLLSSAAGGARALIATGVPRTNRFSRRAAGAG